MDQVIDKLNFQGIEVFQYHNNVLTKDLCDELISYYKDNQDNQTRYNKGPSCVSISDKSLEAWQKLKRISDYYLSSYINQFPVGSVEDFEFTHSTVQHFTSDQVLDIHIDSEHHPMSNQNNRLLGMTRCVGMVAYLNDNFEGGLLKFPVQSLEFKPKLGSLLIFPFGYMFPHLVTPCNKDRYSLRLDVWRNGKTNGTDNLI